MNRLFRRILIAIPAAAFVYVLLHFLSVPAGTVLIKKGPVDSTPAEWGYEYDGFLINSSRRIKLPAWYVYGSPQKANIIILTHNGGSRAGNIARWTADFLLEHGYNVVMVDTRGQGESSGVKTYGYGEAFDVAAIVDEVVERYPNMLIGAIGYSLGAATLLRAVGIEKRLRAVVTFAAFSRLDTALIKHEAEYSTQGKWKGQGIVPGMLVTALRFWAFAPEKIPEPIDAISDRDGPPVLLCHFKADPEILSHHASDLFEAAGRSNVELRIFDEERHLPYTRTRQFEQEFIPIVIEFFDKYLQ